MRIDFQCTGGYIPLELTYNVDTSELPAELGKELVRLVDECSAFDYLEGTPSRGFPDIISYSLNIQEGSRSASVTANDGTAGVLLPLLTRLRQLALEKGR